uniref:WGS project CBMI000000000 data, contig CS3069_c001387 n=1 Tax=Fusarium clavum TaxID=2594811 RepID=A0A090MBL1_9HYPO|nr:unnamed protein product [Fusarium clavum]
MLYLVFAAALIADEKSAFSEAATEHIDLSYTQRYLLYEAFRGVNTAGLNRIRFSVKTSSRRKSRVLGLLDHLISHFAGHERVHACLEMRETIIEAAEMRLERESYNNITVAGIQDLSGSDEEDDGDIETD